MEDKRYYIKSSGRDCLFMHVEVFGDKMVDFCWEDTYLCYRHNCKVLLTKQEIQKYFGDTIYNNPFINVVEAEPIEDLRYMIKAPMGRNGRDMWLNKNGTISTWADDIFVGTLEEIEDAFDEKIVRNCFADDTTEICLVGKIINGSWWLNPIFELEEEQNDNW